MSEKKQPTPDEKDPKAEETVKGEELTDEQLEHVAGGALNGYLKIATVPGETSSGGYKEQIEIESFSWGATQPTIKRS